MQKESIDGLSEISGRIVNLARKMKRVIESQGTDVLSPMVVDCIYQAAANCALTPALFLTSTSVLLLTNPGQTPGTFGRHRTKPAATGCSS